MNTDIETIALEVLDVVAVIGDMWYSLIFPSLNNMSYMKRLGKVAAQPQRKYSVSW